VLSTKTGEIFTKDGSHYDYSHAATIRSVHQSLQRIKTDYLDIVYIHSNGRDAYIQSQTEVIEALQELKSLGLVRCIGFSGKTVEGARLALSWADVVMVEYHLDDYSHAQMMTEAAKKGIGIVVKKGLASGNLPAEEAIRFVLGNPDVHSLVIGGLNINHIKQNLDIAREILSLPAA
jgi:aryl-alcohol dehydrogenase-like predicted oxidoreductase